MDVPCSEKLMRHALAVFCIVAGAAGCGGGDGGVDLDNDVPAQPDTLFSFLKDGGYKGFASESKAHPSSGPHSGDVRVFLNPALAESLGAGNAAHPRGAAAVKELGLKGDGGAVRLGRLRQDGRRQPGRRRDLLVRDLRYDRWLEPAVFWPGRRHLQELPRRRRRFLFVGVPAELILI